MECLPTAGWGHLPTFRTGASSRTMIFTRIQKRTSIALPGGRREKHRQPRPLIGKRCSEALLVRVAAWRGIVGLSILLVQSPTAMPWSERLASTVSAPGYGRVWMTNLFRYCSWDRAWTLTTWAAVPLSGGGTNRSRSFRQRHATEVEMGANQIRRDRRQSLPREGIVDGQRHVT